MNTIIPSKRLHVISLFGIFSVIFELYLFYFLYFDVNAPVYELLGFIDVTINPLDIDYKGIVLIYLGIVVITACFTGIHFALTSMKIEQKKQIVWKGRFLFMAFLFFGISAIFDAMIDLGPIFIIFIRMILILSMFFFYLGFILPKWIRKILEI